MRRDNGHSDSDPSTRTVGFLDSRDWLASIVDSSDDAIVSKDLGGTILSWNAAAERIFGFPAQAAIGRHITLIIPPERRDEEARILSRLAAGERVDHFETVRSHRDGRSVEVSLTISPIKDRHGRVVAASKIARDITERNEQERKRSESEAHFRTLADNISQLAWMADSTGSIFWYNERWLEYTGQSLEDTVGWGWTTVHHPDHVERVVERITHSWTTGEPWEDTFPLRGKDGHYRWFLSRALPIRDARGSIVRWFGTNTDITEQRQLQEHLRNLWLEVAESNRRKDEFLAVLSHELRTPLSVLRTAVAIRSEADGSADGERVRAMADRQISRMSRLLDDLLDLSRVDTGKMSLRRGRLSLNALVKEVTESLRVMFDTAGVNLSVSQMPDELFIDADSARMAQVIENLLSNALKFTPRGRAVCVELNRIGDMADLRIRDEGIGIAASQLERIFEKFVQVDSASDTAKGGLGIGLALVRRLAELHGGHVRAWSAGRGLGSEFVVRLPLTPIKEKYSADDNPTDIAPSLSPRRVLIVDDDRDSAESLALLLDIAGCVTAIATTGTQAIIQSRQFEPSVVILDIGLPDIDGYDVCRRLRGMGSGVLIVAVTGRGQPEDRRRALESGIDHFLLKPFAPTELMTLIATLP